MNTIYRSGFTLIELVFVIVILGILAGVAVPKLVGTREDATISKMRADVSAIRSGIQTKRAEMLMRGNTNYPELETKGSNVLFSNILTNGVYKTKNEKNGWEKIEDNTYKAYISGKSTIFKYNINGNVPNSSLGSFDCNHVDEVCKKLAE